MRTFKEENLPERMKKLPRDSRGVPVPFIVAFDDNGDPHFTINDHLKVRKVLSEDRCGICGGKLLRKRWFLGGPRSAFEHYGRYIDPPMHKECAQFALVTCPYLAIRGYKSKVEDRVERGQEKMQGKAIIVDPTMLPDQPEVFILASTTNARYDISTPDGGATFHLGPKRPWKEVEYWVSGQQITRDEAVELMRDRMTDDWVYLPEDS